VLALWVVVPLCATAYIHYIQYGRSDVPTERNVGPSVELEDFQDRRGAAESRAVGMEKGARRTVGNADSEEGTVSALHT
jgi:hypothetical protein